MDVIYVFLMSGNVLNFRRIDDKRLSTFSQGTLVFYKKCVFFEKCIGFSQTILILFFLKDRRYVRSELFLRGLKDDGYE